MLKKQLKTAEKVARKVWFLRKPLMVTGIVTVMAALGALVWVWAAYGERQLLTVRSLGIALGFPGLTFAVPRLALLIRHRKTIRDVRPCDLDAPLSRAASGRSCARRSPPGRIPRTPCGSPRAW